MKNYVFIGESAETGRLYAKPIETITARTSDEVAECFEQLKWHLAAGRHVAGMASYELGYVLEPVLRHLLPPRRQTPLMQFGVFEGYKPHRPYEARATAPLAASMQKQMWSRVQYTKRFDAAMALIHAGDCYQINLTFPVFSDEPRCGTMLLYADLQARQRAAFGAVVHLSSCVAVSLSPELFFETSGRRIRMRPMKGTAARARNATADRRVAESLRASEKCQAENLMIVDLLRNDLSRICQVGSVKVPTLFDVESYPTVFQMVSEVEGELLPGVDPLACLKSLMPAGSITGAPKIRAMEAIRALEQGPRGIYCGTIGYIEPGGDARFNVAIRTLEMMGGEFRYGIGGAIVAGSTADEEYNECLLKARIIRPMKSAANSSRRCAGMP